MRFLTPRIRRNFRSLNTFRQALRSNRRSLALESLESRRLMAAYINELHLAPLFGSTAEDQYVELRGAANSSLGPGTYLVGIGSSDGVHELGDIHTIFDLSNQSFGSNGLMVLMQSAAGYSVDPAAKLLKGSDGFAGINGFSADGGAKQIRTGSNTFLLIQSATAPALTQDIDSNDDGVPDGAYLAWTILDGVAVFPWVESIWPQRSYAPITFQERGVGQVMPGTTAVATDPIAYVGRIGQSIGYAPDDWVAGNSVEIDDGTGTPTWKFQLQHGVFGVPRPFAYGGRVLDHIGANNWVGSVSGSVFRDDNSDGIQQSGEPGIAGAHVVADLQGDLNLGFISERIEPNNYQVNSDISNISSNVTLVTAGTDNKHLGFKIRPVQRFGAPAGELIFSHENIDFFNEIRRLRMDFYRPATSISIDVIGNSDLSMTYGRLEIFNAAGNSLGFVRSLPLAANQTQRLSISSPNNDIAWAVAYSEDSHLSSSPFGKLDNLTFTLPEQSAVTDSLGRYTIQPVPQGNYSIRIDKPATYDQVYPLGNGAHSIALPKYDNVAGVNFGLLGNLPPKLNDQNYTASESLAAGSVIATLPIIKGYPSQALNITVTGGDPSGLFAINSGTGQLTLARAELDYESQPSYTLQVKLEDKSNAALSDTATVVLTVADANEAPIVASQSTTIAENTVAQTIVATMSATDPDAGTSGPVTWSIASGNVGNAFVVDPTSGVVRINDATRIDFEKNTVFNLVLRATDSGTTPRSGDGMLSIALTNVNEAPILIEQTLSVRENASAGTAVGTLAAIDPDANQQLQWDITQGSGAGLFEIASDGSIKVVAGAAIDFESLSQYEVVVKASDNGSPSLSTTETFTITVLDDNDAPTVLETQVDLSESALVGGAVGKVVASDQDSGQKLRFAIGQGDSSHFQIDANTGDITLAAGADLDFESDATLNFVVTVTDDGATPKSTTSAVTVHLTDANEAPRLTSTGFSVAEQSAAGLKAGTLQAVDEDADDEVSFEVLGQSPTWFTVDSTTGELTVAAGAIIDFEGTNECVMTVRVTDRAGLSTTSTLTITATDKNDPPVLASALSDATATENAPFAYNIPATTFSDDDAGDNVQLFVTTSAGFPIPSWLTYNAVTGDLTGTPAPADSGTVRLKVTAVDSGGASAVTEFSIEVIGNLFPLHNPRMSLDVSGDDFVSARDALMVINHLNTVGAISIQEGTVPSGGWLDTNRDNSVSAIDALLVINEINSKGAGGEGETASLSQGTASNSSVSSESPATDNAQTAYMEFASAWEAWDAAEQQRRRREELVELLAEGR